MSADWLAEYRKKSGLPACPPPDEPAYGTVVRELDEGWYWHLHCDGNRVNGGLSETEADALAEVGTARFVHRHQMWESRYAWDAELSRWVPRA